MLETLDHWIAAVGVQAYLVLGACALIEYVFPPFPGDTVVLLGGIYAVRGQKPWLLVLAIVTLGSVLGAGIDYWVGSRIGRRLDRAPEGRLFWKVTHEQLRHAQERVRAAGPPLILLNRFLPGIRGVVFYAAGAAEIRAPVVLGLGSVSALAWNALLLSGGMWVGGNAEKLSEWVRNYQRAASVLVGIAVLLLAFRWFRKRRGRVHPKSA